MVQTMNVAIIGAGIAGLASAKNAKERGLKCTVYEQWSEIGGVWAYTDYTDTDEYGYPILNPMYAGLTCNVPKELMGFPDFPVPEQQKSYLTQQEMLDFLHSYADHFNLKQLIKLNTIVSFVKPINDGKWEIRTEDKMTKERCVNIFDAVVVCVGNYHIPKMPKIPGMELFKGHQIHSKTYRKPDEYKGKVVLVIGGGSSSIDIVLQISAVAKQVIFSYRSVILNRPYTENVTIKENAIQQIKKHSVTFDDGTEMDVNCIIYCTGYNYKFPFLHESCGIAGGDFVHPLYKHTVNINHPTMAFIGTPIYISPSMTFDLQARFFLSHLLGVSKLPSQKNMAKDLEMDIKDRRSKGLPMRMMHCFNDLEQQYAFYDDLSRLGKTETIPEVICKLYKRCAERYFSGIVTFQEETYHIVDEKNFIHVVPE